jgi:hypothetical protein
MNDLIPRASSKIRVNELEDDRPKGVAGLIQNAISNILKMLENLLNWFIS